MEHEMIALPVYQDRISPLLDVSKKFAVFEIENGVVRQKIILEIHPDSEVQRIEKLKDLGVSVIIGGAVSSFVSEIISSKGIRLISWINGHVDEIIGQYLVDELKSFSGKACGCRKRRNRCGNRNNFF